MPSISFVDVTGTPFNFQTFYMSMITSSDVANPTDNNGITSIFFNLGVAALDLTYM